ncbi:hypothetical protein NECAME_14880, partial [Necator americanus]
MFVVYGGRIESIFDSQVLESYLLTLFNPEKITGRPGQLLAKGIQLLAVDNIKEIQKFITKSIPPVDDPDLFGLPVNIRFSWQVTEAEATIARMRISVASDGEERSSWAEACNPILQLWKRLCQGGDLHSRQVQKIHACLTLVSKSIRGTVTPDKSTTEVIKSLQLHQSPDSWHNLWSGPQDPAQYLTTLID